MEVDSVFAAKDTGRNFRIGDKRTDEKIAAKKSPLHLMAYIG